MSWKVLRSLSLTRAPTCRETATKWLTWNSSCQGRHKLSAGFHSEKLPSLLVTVSGHCLVGLNLPLERGLSSFQQHSHHPYPEIPKQWRGLSSLQASLKTRTASLLLPYMMKSVERSAKSRMTLEFHHEAHTSQCEGNPCLDWWHLLKCHHHYQNAFIVCFKAQLIRSVSISTVQHISVTVLVHPQPFICLLPHKPWHLKSQDTKSFYNRFFFFFLPSLPFPWCYFVLLHSCIPESKLFPIDNCLEHIAPRYLF